MAEVSLAIALRRMPLDLTDDKSALVQVMAWCHQAASHYLSQCWPRSMSPNGATRPQWVKMTVVVGLWFSVVLFCKTTMNHFQYSTQIFIMLKSSNMPPGICWRVTDLIVVHAWSLGKLCFMFWTHYVGLVYNGQPNCKSQMELTHWPQAIFFFFFQTIVSLCY